MGQLKMRLSGEISSVFGATQHFEAIAKRVRGSYRYARGIEAGGPRPDYSPGSVHESPTRKGAQKTQVIPFKS